jgi:hypothetical protein
MGEAGADDEAITVIRVAEAEISADRGRQLQSLLQARFPGYPGRTMTGSMSGTAGQGQDRV